MKTTTMAAAAVLFLVTAIIATGASAACPEGRVEVLVGQGHVLCVSERALPGLQRAAERSGTRIVPLVCPCFSYDEVAEAAPLFSVVILGCPSESPTHGQLVDQFKVAGQSSIVPARFSARGCEYEDGAFEGVCSGPEAAFGDLTPVEAEACSAIVDFFL